VPFAVGVAITLAAGAAVLSLRVEHNATDAATPGAISGSRRTAIVSAAQRVSPAVVSVSVVSTRIRRADPFGGLPRDDFWDRFYPPTEYRERIPGLGSGVIVDASGLVVTNEHVIRNAETITVTLADGQQLPAELLGSSATYDLAVLKVEGRRLPVAPLGDSDGLVVGEWAIAIGSPFGYLLNDTQPTVTAGVVSATRRDIKNEATESGVYKNMIQTDAAINPGNSGGPLVNGDGEVIGINTFIFTSGGGSLGIGFAIPINLARQVLDEIGRYGRVRTAWVGMQVQPVTPYLARRLGYTDLGGLVVTRIDRGGPAEKAGIRVTDRIRSVDGQEIRNVDDAQRSIYGARVGDALRFGIERDGRRLEFALTLLEAPETGR
jgi:serine protease Do